MATTIDQTVSGEKNAPSVARLPILAKDEKVVGYEILFGSDTGQQQSAPSSNPSVSIVDTLKRFGLDVLCDGRLAFVDCTEQLLLQEAFFALPTEQVVLEIPLDIRVNESVIEACKRHKKNGYKIAIDHFRKVDHREYLVPFADFVKVDIASHNSADVLHIMAGCVGKPYKMLAQNVNFRAEFKSAAKAGFTLFQGHFFHHPESMRVRKMPTSQLSKMRLLQAIAAPEVDFHLVDDLIRQDASLCYRLLRYLNSPLLGFEVPVQSVRHAALLLGERSLIQWIRTATAMSMGQPKCSDLALSSLVRARFCELISSKIDHGTADLFLLGMFSLMDVILETPMEILVEGLAFDTSAKAALLAVKNGGGARLSPILDLMVAREKGDWERVATHAEQLNVSIPLVNRAYLEAIEWAHELTKAAKSYGKAAH